MSRRALLAQAHLAAKHLGLDEDTRRAVQREITGQESCGAMSERHLHLLLDHYKSLGWRPKPPRGAQTARQADFPQARLIRALWLQLKALGVLRNASERALRAYVERITGVAALEWLANDPGQANRVIETLKRWVKRVEREQGQG
jgi:phage gp16-like protein